MSYRNSEHSVKIFEEAISNAAVPENVKGVGAREKLRALTNTSYAMADKVGPSGIEKLEKMMTEFHLWCSSQLPETVDASATCGKRKHVPLTQESYDGTAKRVLNTNNMPK